jgi:hypothetical protein
MIFRNACLLVCALSGIGAAQSVRGTVNERSTGAPTAGVVVLLIDGAENAVARSLSSESGSYRLNAPGAGTYRIRTMRVGFRSFTSDVVNLGAGETRELTLSIVSLAVSLDTVRVARRSSCLAKGDTTVATYAVWEQARTALSAAQLSSRSSDLTTTLMVYERALDPTFPRVRRQNTSFTTAISGRSWRSASADSLRRFGYVVPNLLGGKVFLAPDLDVLASSAFLEDHCFRLARSNDEKRIGIEFTPTRARSGVAEISGTLWLDRASAELREMEFKYENLETVESGANPGGEMEFKRLATGAWAITRWIIRMPVLEEFNERIDSRSTATQKVVRVAERRVTGGELVTVLRDEDTVWARPPMVLSGSVVDSVSRDAVPFARLHLRGTSFVDTTDKSGAFWMTGVLPGEYTVEIRTPGFDSLEATYTTGLSFTGEQQRARVLIPPPNRVALDYCGESLERPHPRGLALGTVRVKGDTSPPWNVRVIAEWADGTQKATEARTDAYGRYRICGVPLDAAFTLRTELDDTATVPRAVSVARRARFIRTDIDVAPPTVEGAYFVGAVLTQWTREPLADAEVSLPGLGLTARTNERGRFRLAGVPAGSHRVMVRKVGYTAVESSVEFKLNVPASRQFQLVRVVTLEAVTTTADPRMNEFEEHRRLGLGHFITREELAKLEGARFQDVLSQVPGASILPGFGNHAWLTRGFRGIKGYSCVPIDTVVDGWKGAKQCMCYARVYLDGMLVYSNQPPAGGAAGTPVPLFDLNEIQISQIEAVEYYASEMQMPAKYMSSFANCGVLVIHTRRGGKK